MWEVGGYGLAVGESLEDSGAQMEEVRPEGPWGLLDGWARWILAPPSHG